MKRYDGYLIDLDGTVYRGERKIQAACDFIKRLKKRHLPYLFVTNNSSRTKEQVAEKLQRLDIPVYPEDVLTSGMATANRIAAEKSQAKVYIIGEEGLYIAMEEKGIRIVSEKPDMVVIGIDRKITYEKMVKASIALNDGAAFISTNPDAAIPTEEGLLPGNGALTAVLSTATGRKPTFIGKPKSEMIEQGLGILGTKKENTLVVGDNYETDMLAGIHSSVDTLLVHTGVTTKADLKRYSIQPTYCVESLEEWNF